MAAPETKSNDFVDEKGVTLSPVQDVSTTTNEDENAPTEGEKSTLRRIPGSLPAIAYGICAVEFAERSSYYGISTLIGNFVNRPMPVGGNGYGAPPRGTQQTTGALGLGTVKANAVNQSFMMLAYAVPLLTGYIADAFTGRFKLICWGILVFGVAHVLLVGAAAPSLLANGGATVPYFISLYMLTIGSAMFKPNISTLLLDQNRHTTAKTKVQTDGEKVIVDPEATADRTMTWFYMMINIGGIMAIPTSYSAKYIGWWLAFLLPLFLYIPLPLLMVYLRKRLILHPPGGSDLPNVFRVLGVCLRSGGIWKIGRHGFWESAKPSVIAARGQNIRTQWNDQFVNDVRRTFQAAGIFCFFPVQYINDNGLGQAANFSSTMLVTNGVPNDVIQNFNSLSIIAFAPIVNYGLYPLLRRLGIHYGPIARMTTGLAMSTVGGLGYTVINYYAYKEGPCDQYGSSNTCVDENGVSMVAPISIWWIAIPYALGGISELFINIPAYGVAYSRAPKNMRGLVMALSQFSNAVAYILGLACSAVIRDPYLTWDFGAPCIIGAVLTVVFYFLFRHVDREEYRVSENGDYHLEIGSGNNDNGVRAADAPAPTLDTNPAPVVTEK